MVAFLRSFNRRGAARLPSREKRGFRGTLPLRVRFRSRGRAFHSSTTAKPPSLVRSLAFVFMLVWIGVLSGCATVRPEEREHLAEPGMTFGSDSVADQAEEHVFANREGSIGASSVVGGGCGCN